VSALAMGTDPLRICPAMPSGSGKIKTRLKSSVPVFRTPTLTFREMFDTSIKVCNFQPPYMSSFGPALTYRGAGA
jgi:hypothetical protein